MTVYPPEDGDGPVTCGRCAGTALAVIHDRVDPDLREAVERRLAARIEANRARRDGRRRRLAELYRRRQYGLRQRHADKLNRLDQEEN